MEYLFILEEKPAQPTLSVHTRTAVGNLPAVLGKAYRSLAGYLSEVGVSPVGAPYVGYFNTDMQDMDIEIGFPVEQVLAGKDEIQASEIPSGKRVSCIYTGPYNEVGPVYDAALEWITNNGHISTGTSYEFYLNDPTQTPPAELLTEVVFMLK